MTDSITEIPEVGVRLLEWQVKLYSHVSKYVQVRGNGCARYLLTQLWVKLGVLAEER